MAISDYSTAANSNTAISGINIAEQCPPGNINNAIRQVMADIKTWHDKVNSGASLPVASETVKGVVELATSAETQAGTDAVRAVHPAGLKAALAAGSSFPAATEARKGIVELATSAETQTGTDATRAIHPAGLKATLATGALLPVATVSLKGIVELATPYESTTGTDATRAVTPAGLKAALDASSGGAATSAAKLATARSFSISGGATAAAVAFDGSANVALNVTALDVSKASAGTLAITRGGTGRTDGKVANLASTRYFSIKGGATAAPIGFDGSTHVILNVTDLDVSKATAGILPPERGGTGTTVGSAPKPKTASGVGQWAYLQGKTSEAMVLPSGGTWAYFAVSGYPSGGFNEPTPITSLLTTTGIAAGGTILTQTGYASGGGFAWRIA